MNAEIMPDDWPTSGDTYQYVQWQEACEECGSDDPRGGYVNFGCVTEDCPGCGRCDLPCLTCNAEGRVR